MQFNAMESFRSVVDVLNTRACVVTRLTRAADFMRKCNFKLFHVPAQASLRVSAFIVLSTGFQGQAQLEQYGCLVCFVGLYKPQLFVVRLSISF